MPSMAAPYQWPPTATVRPSATNALALLTLGHDHCIRPEHADERHGLVSTWPLEILAEAFTGSRHQRRPA